MNLFVVRYAELALKGKNRNWFENRLQKNIAKHLAPLGRTVLKKIHGRIIIETDIEQEQVVKVLQYVPGIANFSFALPSTHDMDELTSHALKLTGDSLKNKPSQVTTFRVTARRSHKEFPMNSQELSATIGGKILEVHKDLKVRMKDPDLELGIEIWPKDQAILYLEKIQGQGGLPSGASGRVISFISGGIDSPVSSWFMMKRGCTAVFLHFHSYPFIGEKSKQKVIDLVNHLSRFQPHTTLIVVPFAEIQKAIRDTCEAKNRTILYRRLMFRIAESLKNRFKVKAYVTGEAVGQVASQTLENLACTEAVTTLPVLRPLIGMEKIEIVNWAKTIGTFNISIQPHDDCCTVFQPDKPEIHGKPEWIARDESKLDLESLITETIEKMEILEFDTKVVDTFWDS